MAGSTIEPTEEEIIKHAEGSAFTGGRQKVPIRENRCRARVNSGSILHFGQCLNPVKHTEAGLGWCGVHLPSKMIRRQKINDQKMRAEWKAADLSHAVKNARFKISEVTILHFEQKATFDDVEAAVNEYHRSVAERDAFRHAGQVNDREER